MTQLIAELEARHELIRKMHEHNLEEANSAGRRQQPGSSDNLPPGHADQPRKASGPPPGFGPKRQDPTAPPPGFAPKPLASNVPAGAWASGSPPAGGRGPPAPNAAPRAAPAAAGPQGPTPGPAAAQGPQGPWAGPQGVPRGPAPAASIPQQQPRPNVPGAWGRGAPAPVAGPAAVDKARQQPQPSAKPPAGGGLVPESETWAPAGAAAASGWPGWDANQGSAATTTVAGPKQQHKKQPSGGSSSSSNGGWPKVAPLTTVDANGNAPQAAPQGLNLQQNFRSQWEAVDPAVMNQGPSMAKNRRDNAILATAVVADDYDARLREAARAMYYKKIGIKNAARQFKVTLGDLRHFYDHQPGEYLSDSEQAAGGESEDEWY